MKKCLGVVVLSLFFMNVKADHLSGSELIYEYLGPGSAPNTQRFQFTYRLYRGCSSTSPPLSTEIVTLGIYNTAGLALYQQLQLSYQSIIDISVHTSSIHCFTGSLPTCYGVGIFTGTIELPISPQGYTVSWIRCCRPTDIINLASVDIGVSPVAVIPGSNILRGAEFHNSSAVFSTNDTALVCAGKNFRIDFSATDKDGDSLSYHFVNGTNWTTQPDPNPPPLVRLTYTTVPYRAGYSGVNPTGTAPVLNQVTGIITGVAPAVPGRYLFCVTAQEWRNGVMISEHVKEIPVVIGSCDYIEALLPAKIIKCDTKEVSFENESASSGIIGYQWIFDTLHPAGNISSLPTPTHQYADTGTYTVRLVVTGAACKDSVTTQVLIYPGLEAGFKLSGNCIRYPFLFTDTSLTKGSLISKWLWDFGEAGSQANTSFLQNPSFLYASAGSKTVTLITESEKGCRDTATNMITVTDKPSLNLDFHDTVICRTDTIQLHETSAYQQYQWTPAASISQATTASPKIFPQASVKYYVSVTQNNCDNIDSVSIKVLPKDNVFAGNDTVSCKGDPVYLNASSNAVTVQWSGDATIQKTGSVSTVAFPAQSLQYIITANPGRCATKDTLLVKVVPYPQVLLSADTTICFGDKALLRAQITGAYFSWTPVNTLSDESILSPYAAPGRTTFYILTATDTLGCPKSFSDTVQVSVTPPFHIWAGNDTAVVIGQSLQLQAIVSDPAVQHFLWTPSTGLNDASSGSPVALLLAGTDSVKYKVTGYVGACHAEDFITVKVFAGTSNLLIPTAFSPNGDGLNDVFRIKAVGISKIEFIRVFNRIGQLIFNSSDAGIGWDGTYKGIPQPSGSYVFWAKAQSFNGEIIERKGSVVLLR